MNQVFLKSILSALAKSRLWYFSEADFQHALALELAKKGYGVYLEYSISIANKLYRVDIILEDHGVFYPIELKYKTKYDVCLGTFGAYRLKNHAAHDINRYLFWKDVLRIEEILKNQEWHEGYVIMLTNDAKYWNLPTSSNNIDQLFKIHTGARVNNVAWSGPISPTTSKKYPSFMLNSRHIVPEWIQYSQAYDFRGRANKEFRFLLLSIK